VETVAAIAALRSMLPEALGQITDQNAFALFNKN